ncbi:MAG: class I SAM-dependent methyltransferase [Flavobacteriales bacterium]|nr:class I SAM-dependent methyltransferase [Flavobacteriales bacterium]
MPETIGASKTGRGFNRIAPIYDASVRFVFGSAIDQLQNDVIGSLKPSLNTLIVGGGTGKILRTCMDRALAKHYTYAELSSAMIVRAKRRLSATELEQVTFTDNGFKKEAAFYDLIILPFVLDCFGTAQLKQFLAEMKPYLSKGGKVLLIDFNQEEGTPYLRSIWKELFIRFLYQFFRRFTHIKASRLAPFHAMMSNAGFEKVQETYRYNGWIQAIIWSEAPIE